MKTYKHLYERICAFHNLYDAFRKARKGKRSRPAVAAFEVDLEDNLIALQDELRSEWSWSIHHLHHLREQTAPHQRRALSRPGGPSRAVQRHRADLGGKIHSR